MCGCAKRRAFLNRMFPGLGDKVATVAEPVKAWALLTYMRVMGWFDERPRR